MATGMSRDSAETTSLLISLGAAGVSAAPKAGMLFRSSSTARYATAGSTISSTSRRARWGWIPKRSASSQGTSRQMSTIDGEIVGYRRTTIQQNMTSKRNSIEYVPQGTLTMAKQDLDALRPRNLHRSADGRILMGKLENGNTVKLRPSNDGGRNRWTLEFSKPNGRIIREIRYGDL